MRYKFTDGTNTVVHIINDDGISRSSCSITCPDYLRWISEGNTPEPADVYVETNLDKISKLEALVTNRRFRDAVLSEEGRLWIADIEAQIALLR